MAVLNKARVNAGISPYTGTWGTDEVLHLLRRVHFGVKKADLEYFKTKTMSDAVDEILNVDYTPPSPPINNYNDTTADPNITAGSTWVNDYNGFLNNVRRRSFKSWWTGEMINQDRTIREKMTLFWHNHFSTETQVINWANFAYRNNAVLRADCLKNFKTMVKDMTIDAGMLIYLNGERNTKTAPDENYARELQELFTIGKGPDSQYTEEDIQVAARVLTGWRVNKSTGVVYFDPSRHDTDDKTFSTFYGGNTITGQSGSNGANEVDDLLDMIFLQQEVSKHIVRKLYRWFVYYEIDAATESDVISPLATIFRNNNYEIKPVMEALLKSEHFFDVANRGALIKPPVDFIVGMARSFGMEYPNATNYVQQYDAWWLTGYFSAIQQQDVGDPPSVAGWPAYYQLPLYHEIWINSDTLSNRNKVSDVLILYGYNRSGYSLKLDALAYSETFSNVADPDLFIEDLIEVFHTLEVDQNQKDYMKSWLLAGQVSNSYWTDAWNDYVNDKGNATKANTVNIRLVNLYKYLMNLSEYQLS